MGMSPRSLVLVLALLSGAPAWAQPAPEQPVAATPDSTAAHPETPVTPPAAPSAPAVETPPTSPSETLPSVNVADCTTIGAPPPPTDLASARACLELKRLSIETGWLGLILQASPFLAILISALALLDQQRKHAGEMRMAMARDRATQRQAVLRQFLESLSGSDPIPVRFAAASLSNLLGSVIHPDAKLKSIDKDDLQTARLVMSVAFARLCDPKIDRGQAKHLADSLAKVFLSQNQSKPVLRVRDFNLQNAIMPDAYWKHVDASGADFYGADLSEASFREAKLVEAVFYGATLTKTVFIGANLTKSNFQGADVSGANFSGANLTDATNLDRATFDKTTLWDDKTVWPKGFTPPA